MVVQSKRHIAKTISYRILSSSIGFIVVSLSTGDIKIGAAFSFSELLFKPIIYYIHERIWYRYFKFGIKD
jgi:uncharacterized membrane protein